MVVSWDHTVCLTAKHTKCQRSLSTTEIRDATAESAKSRMEQSRREIFWQQPHYSALYSIQLNLDLTTTPWSFISWLDPGNLPVPNSWACHIILHALHLLVTVFWSDFLQQSTTQLQQILIVVDAHHLLVWLVLPMVLTDISLWMRLPHLINLIMDLVLGHLAMAVVAGALTSLVILMRMVVTMVSTQRHFSTLAQPLISLRSNYLVSILRPRMRPFRFCSNKSRMNRTSMWHKRLFATTKT